MRSTSSSTRHCSAGSCATSGRPRRPARGRAPDAWRCAASRPGSSSGWCAKVLRSRPRRSEHCSSRSTSTPTAPASRSVSTWPGRWPPRTAAPSVRTRPTTAPCSGCGPGYRDCHRGSQASRLQPWTTSRSARCDRTDEAQLHAWWSAATRPCPSARSICGPDWEISRLSLPAGRPGQPGGPARGLRRRRDGRQRAHLPAAQGQHPPRRARGLRAARHRRRGVGSALLDARRGDRRRRRPHDADRRRTRPARGGQRRQPVGRGPRLRGRQRRRRQGRRPGRDRRPAAGAGGAGRGAAAATTGWRGGPTRRPRSTSRRWPPR